MNRIMPTNSSLTLSCIHRDVRTINILLNENLHAKLANFGLSKSFETDGDTHVPMVNIIGTLDIWISSDCLCKFINHLQNFCLSNTIVVFMIDNDATNFENKIDINLWNCLNGNLIKNNYNIDWLAGTLLRTSWQKKSDVYNFGVFLLKIIACLRDRKIQGKHSRESMGKFHGCSRGYQNYCWSQVAGHFQH